MDSPRDASAPQPGRSLVAALAETLATSHFDDMVEELVVHIRAAEPPYEDTATEDLRQSISDNLWAALEDLANKEISSREHPRRTARRRAEQGVPLESVLRAYSIAFRTIWEHMVALAGDSGPDDLHTLLSGAAVVWEAIDAYQEVVSREYRARAAQVARRHERQRQQHLHGILSGQLSRWQVQAGAGAVNLPHDGRFIVVATDAGATRPGPSAPEDAGHGGAPPTHADREQPLDARPAEDPPTQPDGPTPGGDGPDAIEQLEQHLARRGIESAWLSRPDGMLGIIRLTVRHDEAAVGSALTTLALGRVGMSPAVHGLSRCAQVVSLALAARNSFPADRHGVTTVAQRPLAAMAAAMPRAVADQAVQSVLGEVLALPQDEVDLLLETLQAWFDNGGSTSATGSALFCHRNTVRNRLNRISELTGRDVEDPKAASDLRAALLAHQLHNS